MAYNTTQHAAWAQRVRNLMRELDNLAFREGDVLDEIYLNQGGNAAPAAWTDVDFASTAELVNAVVTIRELQAFISGAGDQPAHTDRRARFTPFLQ